MNTGSMRIGAIHGKEKKANEINAKTSVSLVNGLSECKKLFAGTKKERSRFMCKSYLKIKSIGGESIISSYNSLLSACDAW
jgi:hypothetical protein